MDRTSRRSLLATVVATTALAGCTTGSNGDEPAADGDEPAADGDGSPTDGDAVPQALEALPDRVALESFASDVSAPVAMAHAPDEARFYVAEQSGRVVALAADGSSDGTALDLRDAVTSGGEKGLLGIALDPAFPDRRRAYVRYSSPSREGTPDGYSHTFVLASFAVGADGTLERGSERTILELPEPQRNHNAGDLAFGPDDLLYVPTGDGGGAGDRGRGHVEDWYDDALGGNGQDVRENLLGGLLRIDVHSEPTEHPRSDDAALTDPSDGDGYAIPDSNPLVGRSGRDEYYAWGLRNPWRISFDAGSSGGASDGTGSNDGATSGSGDGGTSESSGGPADLYVADVGQNQWEEVSRVERGGNYGWNVREGTHCYGRSPCPESTPDDVRGGEPLRSPIVEYPHGDAPVSGASVIGGHVYRGDAIPALRGAYVFGDLRAGGRLFATVEPEGDGLWPTTTIALSETRLPALYAIGRDADGELYVLGEGPEGSGVWRVRAA